MTPAGARASDPSVREQLLGALAFARRALRFWRLFAASLLLGAVAFGAFLYLRKPHYRSETVILYVEQSGLPHDAESGRAERSVTARLKELLFSRANLQKVVSHYDLYPKLRARYGMVDAVDELKQHIQFHAPGGDTFSIAFDGASPVEAQSVTAQLARQIIEGDTELRKAQSKLALDFLVKEHKSRDADLRSAEEKLAGFMAEHPRFALDTTPLASGAAVRATLGAALGAPSGGPVMPWPAPSAAPAPAHGHWVVRASSSAGHSSGSSASVHPYKPSAEEARARADLAAAREDLAQKLVHDTPAHPDVKRARAEVERAERRLAAVVAAAEQRGGAESQAAAPTSERPSRAPRVKRVWEPAPAPAPASSAVDEQGLVGLETEWLKLTRAVTEARQQLDQVEAQLFRADIESSSQDAGHALQVSVIDPAYLPPKPLPPGKTVLGLLFIAGSCLLGGGATLLAAAFSQRIFEARELLGLSDVLVEVPNGAARRAHAAS